MINVYLFILSPSVWLASVTSPMTDHLFPLGIGIVSLVTGGILNIRSSLPFTVIEAVALIGCATMVRVQCETFSIDRSSSRGFSIILRLAKSLELLLLRTDYRPCLYFNSKRKFIFVDRPSHEERPNKVRIWSKQR